jgi:flagellar hook-basal body complex protein FliE
MSIDAVGAIGGLSPISPLGALGALGAADNQAASTSGADFAAQLSRGLGHVQGLQDKADDLSVKAATGSLTDVHDFVIASTEAALAFQLTAALRNKAVEAFNEIMRMQA